MELTEGDKKADKLNHFDVSAEVECSFLGGKIKIAGAAKYINDDKVSIIVFMHA